MHDPQTIAGQTASPRGLRGPHRRARGLTAASAVGVILAAGVLGLPSAHAADRKAPPRTAASTSIPALKDVLGASGIAHVGVAIDDRETSGPRADLIKRQFNAFTPENAGKPQSIQPVEGTFTFGALDRLLDSADSTGMKVYYHVGLWHAQTPDWFFLDGGRPLTNSPADQALLKSRMATHLKAIAGHIKARYPAGNSPIWAMDVVNEVINDGPNGNPHNMRSSRWFQVLGEGFVDEAFRLAHQDFPGVKLFINDYNTDSPSKRTDLLGLVSALEKRGVPVQGVGHQTHEGLRSSVSALRDSIRAVKALDPNLLEAITELDVSSSQQATNAEIGSRSRTLTPIYATKADTQAAVGYFYRDLFTMIRAEASSIASVTFWGADNDRSWLRGTNHPWEEPLPFGDNLLPAPAYWGIVDATKLPPRPAPPRL